MNTKYAAVAVILIAILSVSLIYVYYVNQTGSQPEQGSIKIIDSQGYETTLPSVPQKIISLAPSVTPILYEIGVGDKIVGLTSYDDSPYDFSAWFEAGNMTCVGGFSTPNLETITSLQPDIIFSTNVNDESIPNMRELGLKVIVVGPKSINEILDTINLIGKATGAETKAAEVVNTLSAEISEVQEKIAEANIIDKVTLYYEVYYDESGIMTAGSGSWLNNVFETAGGINIFSDLTAEWPNTSSEVIVQRNPSVIILPSNMGTGVPFYGSVDEVKARPGWSTIDAIMNDRLFVIEQDLLSEPGIRVAEQVQVVAACLYPQLFNSTP